MYKLLKYDILLLIWRSYMKLELNHIEKRFDDKEV